MRNIRLQVIVTIAGLIVLGALLIWQASGLVSVLVPAEGGTYIEGVAGTPQVLNPLFTAYNQADRDVSSLLFDGMTRLDARGQVEPRLAERWEISEDERTYTFHLRSDVKWSDGQPFSADDVVFTVGLLQDPGYDGPADVAALWRSVVVTRVNTLEVQFTLPTRYPPFLDYTTVGVVPEHILRGVTADGLLTHPFNQQPVGTGLFYVARREDIQWTAGRITQILLSTNPYAWDQTRWSVHLSKFEFKFYPDEGAALSAYETGEVQGVAHILAQDMARAQAQPTLSLYTARLAGYSLILLNTDNVEVPYFAETPVRQALLIGLDRQALIDKYLNGQGLVADSPIIPGTWAYNANAQRYEHNASQARAILDSSGWILGGADQVPGEVDPSDPSETGGVPSDVRAQAGVLMEFTLLVNNDPRRVALAEAIAAQWGEIGVKVKVRPVTGSLVRDYLQPHQFEAALLDVALPGDPDLYPFWHETQVDGGQNYAGYRDRDMSELLEDARLTTVVEERIALYGRFQEMFARDVPALLLYYPTYTYGVDEKVGGVQVTSLFSDPSDRLRHIADWYVVRRRVVTSGER